MSAELDALAGIDAEFWATQWWILYRGIMYDPRTSGANTYKTYPPDEYTPAEIATRILLEMIRNA